MEDNLFPHFFMESKPSFANSLSLKRMIIAIWIINCILGIFIAVKEIWIPNMRALEKNYNTIISDPFNGTSLPITQIPNWLHSANQNKSTPFSAIPVNEFIPMPLYDITALQNANNTILRYTYTVPYMGSYELNYKEYDWSHLGVDIRAPIGTPIMSIANWVVVRTVEADSTGNKYVVIRHDNVPLNGTKTTLYSAYLHLSEISVVEGTKIRKGEMLGRVGMTGITTTPHLHFQIDTADAPFHPYWPFTSAEAKAAGMNIFEAVSAWLGADRGLKYTIHPLEFVQHNLSTTSNSSSSPYSEKGPKNIPLKSLEEIVHYTHPATTIDSPITLNSASSKENDIKMLEDIVSFNAAPNTIPSSALSPNTIVVASKITNTACKNIDSHLNLRTSFGIKASTLQNENCALDTISSFSENTKVLRKEAIVALMKLYKYEPLNGISQFADVSINETELQWYLLRAYQSGILSGSYFRGNNTITKWEFVELIARFGKLRQAPSNYTGYLDNFSNSTLYNSVNNFAYTISTKSKYFQPNTAMTLQNMVDILSALKNAN